MAVIFIFSDDLFELRALIILPDRGFKVSCVYYISLCLLFFLHFNLDKNKRSL